MIDVHTHILPGIDDGSRDIACSIDMLQREAEQGVTHVICTPHFYPHHDRPEAFLSRRRHAEESLRLAMEKYTGLPEVIVGAEVFFYRGISDSDFLNGLTFGSKPCIMIEMAGVPFQPYVYDELEAIYNRHGIIPIVAHIDRYISRFRTYGIPDKLKELPVLVQANADFFLRKQTVSFAMKMLKSGYINLLGSDCHNLDKRPPNLGEAISMIESKLGNIYSRQMLAEMYDLFELKV